MPLLMKTAILTTLLTSLSACVNATASGDRGCSAYAEARTTLPPDADLLATPRPVLAWINSTDARLAAVCN